MGISIDEWTLIYVPIFPRKKIVSVQFWLWIRRVWSFLTTIFAIIVIILNIIILFYLDKHNQISIYFGNSDTKCVNYHSFYYYLFQISLQHHDILLNTWTFYIIILVLRNMYLLKTIFLFLNLKEQK